MSTYVLDTDILSLYQYGDPKVTGNVKSRSPTQLSITVISVEESLSGWYTLVRRARKPDELATAYARLATSVKFLGSWQILDYTQPAIGRYEQLKSMKLNVAANDLRIAAVVLDHSATLVTRNVTDFQRIPGLQFVDWSV